MTKSILDTTIIDALVMSESDNVAVVLKTATAGQHLKFYDGKQIRTRMPIPRFHKVAIQSLALGDPVKKYGQIIGVASCQIDIGDCVHTHNVRSQRAQASELDE